MLGVGGHLTDSGIHINSDRTPVGTPTRGPDPFQCFPQGLVHLADMTPCERTKKRAQCGRGHHPKTAAPCRWNRPAADQHDQYGTRPPASMPPKTAPCDPDTLLPGDLPAVRSRPATAGLAIQAHPVEVFNYGSEADERCVISAMVGVGASAGQIASWVVTRRRSTVREAGGFTEPRMLKQRPRSGQGVLRSGHRSAAGRPDLRNEDHLSGVLRAVRCSGPGRRLLAVAKAAEATQPL